MLGIIESADQAITGAELNEISDEEFELAVEKYSVYARVQPEHKTRIVNAWKKKGKVTAMTGDVVVEVPFLCNAFELASLNLTEYAIAMALAISIIPIVEIFKILHRMIDRKKNRDDFA